MEGSGEVKSRNRIKFFEGLTATAADSQATGSNVKKTSKLPKLPKFSTKTAHKSKQTAGVKTTKDLKSGESGKGKGKVSPGRKLKVENQNNASCCLLPQICRVIFQSRRDEHKIVKGAIGAFFGLILGAATYFSLAYALEFPMIGSAIAAGITGLLLCIGLAVSTQCRVVVCLCMPTLSLKSGRLVLTTIAVTLMLTGPLMTISSNGSELAIMPSCTADLLYNESVALVRIARAPFEEFKEEMKESLDRLQSQLDGLKSQWNKAKESLQWIESVRMKLPINAPSAIGDTIRKIDTGLEAGIEVEDFIQGDVQTIPTNTDVVKQIRDGVTQKVKFVNMVMLQVKRVISLSVLIIVVQSYLYLRGITKTDNHDNMYITPLFVEVDEKRKKKGKPSLLPLTPSERKLITDKRQVKMSQAEIKGLITGLIPATITIAGAILVILLDFALYEGIKYIRRFNEIAIDVDQETDITVWKQNGHFPRTKEFAINQATDHHIDISVCLPVGTKPNENQYLSIGIVYFVLLLTVIFQAYLIRLRHWLALYFYPETEVKRVKSLHRMLAKQRVITVLRLKDELHEKRLIYKSHHDPTKPTGDKGSKISARFKKAFSCCCKTTKKCYICDRKASKSLKLSKCHSCKQSFCEECTRMVIGPNGCPCLDTQYDSLYNTISDSDFEDAQLHKTIPASVNV